MCHTTPVLANTCRHLLYYNLITKCPGCQITSHLSNIERGTPRQSNRFRYCVECIVIREPGLSYCFVQFKQGFYSLFVTFRMSEVERTIAWCFLWENLYRSFEDSSEEEVCSIEEMQDAEMRGVRRLRLWNHRLRGAGTTTGSTKKKEH